MKPGQELYNVVKNYEDQYSIWLAYKEIPHGWDKVHGPLIKEDCLKYIGEVWKDMRPKSLKCAMSQ